MMGWWQLAGLFQPRLIPRSHDGDTNGLFLDSVGNDFSFSFYHTPPKFELKRKLFSNKVEA